MATSKPNLTRVWAASAPGSKVVDPDVTEPGKFATGWGAEIPPFESFNFLQKMFSQGLVHINEQGVPVWDADTTYPVDAIVKGSDGSLYIALTEQSGNDPVSDPTNWVNYHFSSRMLIAQGFVAKSVTELGAITASVEGQRAFLSSGGRSGPFNATLSDISTQVAADPLQGEYIAFTSDPTGASGGWIRTISGFVTPEMWGLVLNSTDDQTAQIEAAIKSGHPVIANNDFYANINITDVDVDVTGSATIRPYSRTSPTFTARAQFTDVINVSAVSTTTATVDGMTDKTVSVLTVASHTFSYGDVIKVVSEDVIPECTADGTRLGEWAVVLDASSPTLVYLDRELRGSYSTTIRVGKVSSKKLLLGVSLKSTTGNGVKGGALALIKGFRAPIFDLTVSDNDGPGLVLHSCWKPEGVVRVTNLTNDTGSGIYGYGVADAGCGMMDLTIHQDGFCRHAYTTIDFGNTDSDLWSYGEPWNCTVRGKAVGCTSNAWDTHEQGDGVRFLGVEAHSCRSFGQSRSKGTVFNGFGSKVDFGVQVRNTGTATKAEAIISSVRLTDCKKPYNFKDDSATGNQCNVRFEGDNYASGATTVSTTLLDATADVTINGTLEIVNTNAGGAVTAILNFEDGTVINNGTIKLGMADASAVRPIRLVNASFTSKGLIDLDSAGVTYLFTSSGSTEAAASDISVDKIIVNTALPQTLLFEYAFNSESVTVENTNTISQSTNSVFVNTGTSTEIPVVSKDPHIMAAIQVNASFTSITAIDDGKFYGQRLSIWVSGGSTLDVNSSLPNVNATASIALDKVASYIWRNEWILETL